MSTDDSTVARDYLVTPEVARGPGVLVLHSGRGLTDFVRQFCHRLSREGFVALAPDLFEGRTPTTVEAARECKASLDGDRTGRRLEDVAEFLRRHESVSRRTVGVVGFGYGAEWACTVATELGGDCGGAVLFYGLADADWGRLEAPVLGHFAQLDHELPRSRVNELRNDFQERGVTHDLFVYQDTEPSFFETDETARHDPEAARLAWERTLQFLKAEIR